jgi:Prokaryotic homologs of the JAB domain
MTTLESIREFIIPRDLCDETDVQLRAAGREQVERFVLWSGVVNANTFHAQTAHVPRQTAYRLEEGLCVRVEGEELHRLNVWLFERGEQLAVQVHSHPTEAYHSETDDTYPIVTIRGGLSLVVPHFGRTGVRGPGTALYRLGASGWDELETSVAQELLRFED